MDVNEPVLRVIYSEANNNASKTSKIGFMSKEYSELEKIAHEPAMKGFLAITELWGFSDEEKSAALGLEDVKLFKMLKSNPKKATKEQIQKISYMLCIYDNLGALLGDGDSADSWLRRADEESLLLKNGKTPLQNILSGKPDNIAEVCRYLVGVSCF